MLGKELQKLGLEGCVGVYQLVGKIGEELDRAGGGNNDNALPEEMSSLNSVKSM